MSRFLIAYNYVTCTAPGHIRCLDFLLPTRHMHCTRTGQMSRFPIAYTSHALPQDRTDVQISYCLHVTYTAPGQDRCPNFLLPTHHMHYPRTGQMSRFPITYTSHALPQDRADVHADFLLPTRHMHQDTSVCKNIDAKHYYFKSKKHASIVPRLH